MYAVSLALVVLSQVSIPTNQDAVGVRNPMVLPTYEDAYHRAGQEGKPILVLFTSQSNPSELQSLQSQGTLNGFLVVVADRNTEAGRRTFAMFNWQAPEGVSVIERTRQWQFARYERKLSGDELARVANATRNAVGYPTFDPLTTNVSAYPPPQGQQPQGGQAGVQGHPGVPGHQPQWQPQQWHQPQWHFQSMPMMMGGGGGCAGGRCR